MQSKPRMVPFVGGEWQGEAREFTGNLEYSLEIGDPPRYIGNNQYDPNGWGHDIYHLVMHNGKPYYVQRALMDEREDFPNYLFEPRETPNGKRIREEKERHARHQLRVKEDSCREELLKACIAKHEFLDNNNLENPALDEAIEVEGKAWKALKTAQNMRKLYKGEKPELKEVSKI